MCGAAATAAAARALAALAAAASGGGGTYGPTCWAAARTGTSSAHSSAATHGREARRVPPAKNAMAGTAVAVQLLRLLFMGSPCQRWRVVIIRTLDAHPPSRQAAAPS